MSNLSRWEINELLKQFRALCLKIETESGGNSLPLATGVEAVEAALAKGDGAPDLHLRNLGKLMKHYLEEARKKPSAIVHFNVAVGLLAKHNNDVQATIRRTRQIMREVLVDMRENRMVGDAELAALQIDRYPKELQKQLEV